MYFNQNKKVKNKKLEKSARVLNPGRDENSNALPRPAIRLTIIISKFYKSSELRPSGKFWHKIFVLLGRLC